MPILLPKASDTLDVVLSFDSALDMSEEEFDAYVDAGYKADRLKFKEGQAPTVFVLRKVLNYDQFNAVTSKQVRMEKGVPTYDFSSSNETVRAALCGIRNPEGLPEEQQITWKRGSDGSTSEELMALLAAAGVIPELFRAFSSIAKREDELKKK